MKYYCFYCDYENSDEWFVTRHMNAIHQSKPSLEKDKATTSNQVSYQDPQNPQLKWVSSYRNSHSSSTNGSRDLSVPYKDPNNPHLKWVSSYSYSDSNYKNAEQQRARAHTATTKFSNSINRGYLKRLILSN